MQKGTWSKISGGGGVGSLGKRVSWDVNPESCEDTLDNLNAPLGGYKVNK